MVSGDETFLFFLEGARFLCPVLGRDVSEVVGIRKFGPVCVAFCVLQTDERYTMNEYIAFYMRARNKLEH